MARWVAGEGDWSGDVEIVATVVVVGTLWVSVPGLLVVATVALRVGEGMLLELLDVESSPKNRRMARRVAGEWYGDWSGDVGIIATAVMGTRGGGGGGIVVRGWIIGIAVRLGMTYPAGRAWGIKVSGA